MDGSHAQLAGESVDENADSSKDGPERTGKIVTNNHLGCNTISPMKETLRNQFLAVCESFVGAIQGFPVPKPARF